VALHPAFPVQPREKDFAKVMPVFKLSVLLMC